MQRYAGHRLRAARQAASVPKEQAALAVGRSFSSITLYENGSVEPPLHILCTLSSLYSTDVASFFEEVNDLAA